MFQVWSRRAHRQRLSMPGKRQRDVRLRQRASHQNVSLDQITVASVRSKIITICGQIGGSKQEVLLDSGSAVLLRQDVLKHVATGIERTEPKLDLHLVTAAGENLPIVDQVSITVKLGLRQRASHQNVSLDQITVASVRSKIITICGQIGGSKQEVLLDSGSAVLLRQDVLKHVATGIERTEPKLDLHLVTAAGENLPIVDQVSITVKLGDLERRHNFLVVKSLITPAILGMDFLQKHKIVLDFSTMPVTVTQMQDKAHARVPAVPSLNQDSEKFSALWESGVALKRKWCPVAGIDMAETNSEVMIEDCAVPHYGEKVDYEFPKDVKACFVATMRKFKNLFITKPGTTTVTSHHITTTGPPVRVPPRRIPAHFRDEVEAVVAQWDHNGKLQSLASTCTVYVPKKSGEVRLCVDYRELNERTVKDAYPLPLVDEVQGRLAGAAIFSKLDLQSGYWQLPMEAQDREKTAFSPGPGM